VTDIEVAVTDAELAWVLVVIVLGVTVGWLVRRSRKRRKGASEL
jgi:hypothetical protein